MYNNKLTNYPSTTMCSHLTTPPLSLYIHFPWCVQKCPYCDFNSHALKEQTPPEDLYIDRLIAEFDHKKDLWHERPIVSMFLGGGTPSLFSANAIKRLLRHIRSSTKLTTDVEITLEANPGAQNSEKFIGYHAAGINRLSIGVQSFCSKHLAQLGRIHNPEQARTAILNATAAGFKRINADIMFGLPQQTPKQALADLQQALELPISHLSWYQLTIEPNTYFHRFPPQLPTDDLSWEIQQGGQTMLKEKGFDIYEISAYAPQQDYCRHNLNYWQFGDYLGIGAGAHSKITNTKTQDVQRMHNEKHPKRYQNLDLDNITTKTQLPATNRPFEFFMNAARLMLPITKDLFTSRTGCELAMIEPTITQAITDELIVDQNEHWLVTNKGHQYLNELLALFLHD